MLFPLALALRFHSLCLKKASLSQSVFPQSILLQIALLSFSFDTPFFLTPQRLIYILGGGKSLLSLSILKMHPFFSTFKQGTLKMPCMMMPLYTCKLGLYCHYLFYYMVHLYLPVSPTSSYYWQPDNIIHKVQQSLLFSPKYFLQDLFSFCKRKCHFSFYSIVLSISKTAKEIIFIQTLSDLVWVANLI